MHVLQYRLKLTDANFVLTFDIIKKSCKANAAMFARIKHAEFDKTHCYENISIFCNQGNRPRKQ